MATASSPTGCPARCTKVTHPDVLRVTPASCAFEGLAAALRTRCSGCDGNFFHKSRKSEQIGTFWSHSWHGGQWKKIITLLVFYNGGAAVVLGFLTALLMMPLFAFGLLPGFRRGRMQVDFSTWSLCSGVLVAGLVMLLWRPRTPVFLDRICIDQHDGDLKAQAIFSLAGLLKKSKKMLILWDPTWTDRLWCLFELAAFLKSGQVQEKPKPVLIIRPSFFGPLSIAVFFTLFALVLPFTTMPTDGRDLTAHITVQAFLIPAGVAVLMLFVVGYAAVSTVRHYFRDLDVMKEQLLAVSFDLARSSCCEQGHVSPTGEQLLCDRKVVKECVTIWFGSQSAFEDTLRSQVLEILTRDLSERVFTTTWMLSVTSPLIWAFLDLAISMARHSQKELGVVQRRRSREKALDFLVVGLSVWLLAIPSIKDVLILSVRLTRRRPRNWYLEVLKNTAALCLVSLPILVLFACFLLTRFLATRLVAAGAFAACMLVMSAAGRLLACGLRALVKRPGW